VLYNKAPFTRGRARPEGLSRASGGRHSGCGEGLPLALLVLVVLVVLVLVSLVLLLLLLLLSLGENWA
jgi:hypothetical protein